MREEKGERGRERGREWERKREAKGGEREGREIARKFGSSEHRKVCVRERETCIWAFLCLCVFVMLIILVGFVSVYMGLVCVSWCLYPCIWA